jgi:EAL domain-containing protein (putative c-di-GMP-specific phosphodiesterase class I)/GGDEF domain-containing protein
MTLFKQMAIAISIMIIILLASVMGINYQTSKKDMIQSLYETTVNNISSLTNKLSESAQEPAEISSTVDAEFDSGYFKVIEFKSTDGKFEYKQIDNDPVEGVPLWFVEFSNIKLESITADISSGWNIIGQVTVLGDTGIVYKALYKMFINLSYIFAVSITVFLLVLNVLLSFVLRPLKRIETLSKNISQGKFETIKKIPSTLELKSVSISMNDMSTKIKDMITKLNKNLEKMTAELSKDELTGLEQEQTFNTDMKMMFIKKQDGYIFSIKIYDFVAFAKNNSPKNTDKFLKGFANILTHCNDDSNSNITAYRFFGSTFALISKQTDHHKITQLTKNLQSKFNELAEEYGVSNIVHIGVTPFNPISTTENILALANEAHDKAVLLGANEFFIRNKDDLAKEMLIWKEMVCGIIDNATFNVGYINQCLSMDGERTILSEETVTSATDNDDKAIQIGSFLAVAEMYNKVIDFDKAVIKQIIEHIIKNQIKHEILINITFESMHNDNFTRWLKEQLVRNKDIASQLVFSITAYGCVKDIDTFKSFITLLHENGSKIMLKRFETKFIPLDNLKDFSLDYIRLARAYTVDICSDKSKQSFIESICELSKLLNIKVFVEEVKNEDEFNTFKELGIYGAGLKNILKFHGLISQGVVNYCMLQLEDAIVNESLMSRVATVSIELLQNMMNYSKDINSSAIKPEGFIQVTKNKDSVYCVQSQNIISLEDLQSIEPKLIKIKSLNPTEVRKEYRELRKSGHGMHEKGGGIGFYEIAKLVTQLDYEFIEINKDRYHFIFKVKVKNNKKKMNK